MNNPNMFTNLKRLILLSTVFLFPLFFLPVTQEYYLTSKMYLLSVSALLLIGITAVEFIVNKKIVFQKKPFDGIVFFTAVAVAASVIMSSPNKIQALMNVNYGLVPVLSLTILYYFGSRYLAPRLRIFDMIAYSSTILAVSQFIFFFQPLKNAKLPIALQFLQNPSFTPMGNTLDALLILGAALLYLIYRLYTEKKDNKNMQHIVLLVVVGVGFALTLFSFIKPIVSGQGLLLAPFSLSWYAALEILKNPLTALFGVGTDNFASIFSRVKDAGYNQSAMWQISSFNISHSALLQIITETGLLGAAAFGFLLYKMFKVGYNDLDQQTGLNEHLLLFVTFVALVIVMALLPISLTVLFLLFILAMAFGQTVHEKHFNAKVTEYDLKDIIPLYAGMALLLVIFIGVAVFFLGQMYLADVYYKRGLDGYVRNNAKALYDNQLKAISLNPNNEGYRLGFAQTNLLLANNVIQNKKELSDKEKQAVVDAIQNAIFQSKAAVTLNPYKAIYWENLAGVYRSVLNVAQGADVWTVSAYQKAMQLDPKNPLYPFSLGSVLYSLNQYDQARQAFEQAVVLKPDWANAHYNLAWAYYQTSKYQDGIAQLQAVQSLIDPKKDKADYEKLQKDIAEFQKKLPKENTTEQTTDRTGGTTKQQLSLPQSTGSAILSPKVQLPKAKEASPEAQ